MWLMPHTPILKHDASARHLKQGQRAERPALDVALRLTAAAHNPAATQLDRTMLLLPLLLMLLLPFYLILILSSATRPLEDTRGWLNGVTNTTWGGGGGGGGGN